MASKITFEELWAIDQEICSRFPPEDRDSDPRTTILVGGGLAWIPIRGVGLKI
jgi:hypothetical protein